MGTKANPGKYDAHAKAHDDEPLFTLLARDPLAPVLIRLWCALREHAGAASAKFFAELCAAAAQLEIESADKITDALACARDAEYWRMEHPDLSRPASRDHTTAKTTGETQ